MLLIKWSNCSTYWSIHHSSPNIETTLSAHQRSRSIKSSPFNNLLLGKQSVYIVNIFLIYHINDVNEQAEWMIQQDCDRRPFLKKNMKETSDLFQISYLNLVCEVFSFALVVYNFYHSIPGGNYPQYYIPRKLTDPHMLCVQNLIFAYTIITSWHCKKYDFAIFD